MAKVYDYTATSPVTIEIKNVIDKDKYVACDAGTPVHKVEMLYSEIKDNPCVKFDYVFNRDGSFKTNGKTDSAKDFYVLVYTKFKSTDRIVPAYKVRNAKTLKVGESMKFATTVKDEVVFYEKVAAAFKDELEVKINGEVVK